MNSFIENIIEDYVCEKNIDYAVLISGDWGFGKTHFINNNIERIIEKNSKKFIYISLYGIESLDDLKKQILVSKYALLNKKGIKVAASAIGLLTSSIAINPVFNISVNLSNDNSANKVFDLIGFENYVICFDDLERMSSKLEINDVIGFINATFVEHKKIHTIIACNYEKLKERYPDLELYSEKTIGRLIKFEYEVKEILQILNQKLENKISNFESSNIEPIIEKYILETNERNLRTLIYSVNIINKILNILYLNKMDVDKNILIRLIEFILYTSSKFKNKLSNIKENTETNTIEQSDAIKNLDLSIDSFFSRDTLREFISVHKFIIDGYFNENDIVNEIIKINKIYQDSLIKSELEILHKLDHYQYKKLSESDFNNYVNSIIDALDKELYPLYHIYNDILKIFKQLMSVNLLDFKTKEELDTFIESYIHKVKYNENEEKIIDYYSFDNELISKIKNDEDYPKSSKVYLLKRKEILDEYYKNKNIIYKKDLDEDINNLSKIIQHDPFVYMLESYSVDSLTKFTYDKLLESNEQFLVLTKFLEKTFLTYYNCENNQHFIPILEDYKNQLKEKVVNDKIKNLLLDEFILLIDNRINNLSKWINKDNN